MVKDGIFLGNRYQVLSKIGAGGMADVYKGKDTMLNRFVAIKVLKKEYREDENFVRKFRSEAQAAAGLLNPNIVNVYDVGEDRGLYYMVMELVEGKRQTVSQRSDQYCNSDVYRYWCGACGKYHSQRH